MMFRSAIAAYAAFILVEGALMAADATPRLPELSNDAAWKRLPDSPERSQPLPAWARVLAGWQPVTTARMLELDALHRSGDRLDARFRSIVRWAAADANRCEYARAMAVADYARLAGATADLTAMMQDPAKLPEVDRLGASFARKMMLEASKVTDSEVKTLISLIGDERMVALVALVAHASFQDRVFLALNITPEANGVPPPVTVKFGRPKPATAGSHHPDDSHPSASDVPATEAWLKAQKGLAAQQERPGRIAIPSEEWLVKRLGSGHPALWQKGILWSRVCLGHQPELTELWFETASAFRNEGSLDPMFSNAIFWTVTESLNCFY